MKNGYLYIKVDKNNLVRNKRVYLEDVAKLYSTNKRMVIELNHQVILIIKEDTQTNYIFSILKIIEEIDNLYPEVEVINLGETDFIVHYEPPKRTFKLIEYAKVVFVSLMVFFGGAFAIMTFDADVSVTEVFDKVYELIMGSEKEGGTILEISYSIGLPLGIIVFFNHFSKVKIGNDPTPLQVQLRLYEENLDKTLIQNASREGNNIDAD
jgi:stage V sporulation protein AA